MTVTVLDRNLRPDPRVSASDAAVSLRNVSRSFGANRVLQGIDLDIPAGQFVVIVAG